MSRGQTETLDEKHQRLLEAFVLRARRVEEHSLAADWEALVELTRMSINVRVDQGEVWISYELPPEEVVESAAARIRPILLEKEDCFHMKALSALGYTCRAAPQDAAWIRAARAEWRTRVSPSTRDESGYWVMVADTSTGEERDLDAHGLAMAWIYGDVVHHDPERRKEGDTFGLRDRFRAAVPLVAWAMVGTIELLNFVRALNEAGMLKLRQQVFDEQVALKSTTWEERTEMYYAPVGAQPPSLASAPMPEGWLPLSTASDLSVFRHRIAGQLLNTESTPSMTDLPSPEEVEAARTPAGGWKRDQLAAWGVPWPPPKGWKDELVERWKAAGQDGAPPPPTRPAPAPDGFVQETLDFG
ncbi:hypothetical protein [Streptomyces cyaneofuscatus]|uniref:hypothetical protein n=1 Tax=Streptomyces cyaneofuscatus TaxID=66883 RepID=UPI003417FF07